MTMDERYNLAQTALSGTSYSVLDLMEIAVGLIEVRFFVICVLQLKYFLNVFYSTMSSNNNAAING